MTASESPPFIVRPNRRPLVVGAAVAFLGFVLCWADLLHGQLLPSSYKPFSSTPALQTLSVLCSALCIAAAISFARLAVAGHVARFDATGAETLTLFGRKRVRWNEVTQIETRDTRYGRTAILVAGVRDWRDRWLYPVHSVGVLPERMTDTAADRILGAIARYRPDLTPAARGRFEMS